MYNRMKINARLTVFLIIGFLVSTASASVDVDLDVSLPDDRINTGERFDVQIEITNTDNVNLTNADIDVVIYVEGTKVYENTWSNIDTLAGNSYIRNVS